MTDWDKVRIAREWAENIEREKKEEKEMAKKEKILDWNDTEYMMAIPTLGCHDHLTSIAFSWTLNTMYTVRCAKAVYVYKGNQVTKLRWFLIITNFDTGKTRIVDEEPATNKSCKELAEKHYLDERNRLEKAKAKAEAQK